MLLADLPSHLPSPQILDQRSKCFQGGLDKLLQTAVLVSGMQRDLLKTEPVLDTAVGSTTSVLEELVEAQKVVAEARDACLREEAECKVWAHRRLLLVLLAAAPAAAAAACCCLFC